MRKPHIIRLAVVLILFVLSINAQEITISKIEPANWWTNMKTNEIQLMVYGENLSNVSANFSDSPLVVTKVHNVENNSYCFIDIRIPSNSPSGNYNLVLSNSTGSAEFQYPIYDRLTDKLNHNGFNNEDLIYLITPDRFANGDTTNDSVSGLKEGLNRKDNYGRHGGDIQGLINKLDYLKDLGITAIWLNPVVENNTQFSYHGYAATDFYNIDARFGSNDLYKKFVNEAHKRDIKIIWDHVANHCSIDHPWLKNLPMPDWINGSIKNHLNAEHHKMVLSDPHGNEETKKYLQQGWFSDGMPDLNQKNPFVAKYIIQNTIWWMEFAGIDGIREDTYPYADQKFLADWAKIILDEYPNSNIVGEVWTGVTAFLSYYQKDSFVPRKFNSNLPSVTDFAFRDRFYDYLSGNSGIYKIYETLSKDYLYPNPDKLVTFLDNHDVVRIMYAAKENLKRAKLALGVLFTTRGIPQILYGTEIAMVGGADHGSLRADFPGGFPGDSRDAFKKEGRTVRENEMFDYTKKLLSLRKKYKSLTSGKLIHYPPVDGVYSYFREFKGELMLVIANSSDKEKNVNLKNLGLELKKDFILKDLITEKVIDQKELGNIKIDALTLVILKI